MGKNLPANTGNVGSIPGWRRSPGEGNGNLLQYSCLGNPAERGTRQSRTRQSVNTHTHAHAHTRLSLQEMEEEDGEYQEEPSEVSLGSAHQGPVGEPHRGGEPQRGLVENIPLQREPSGLDSDSWK